MNYQPVKYFLNWWSLFTLPHLIGKFNPQAYLPKHVTYYTCMSWMPHTMHASTNNASMPHTICVDATYYMCIPHTIHAYVVTAQAMWSWVYFKHKTTSFTNSLEVEVSWHIDTSNHMLMSKTWNKFTQFLLQNLLNFLKWSNKYVKNNKKKKKGTRLTN